ncbi:MAG: SRPBCC domain-containing protein [Caulobacteraceae bacterium]|nr:SRPBCC domain-containing protein [Caulobacteraceae bacterium]
MTKDVQSPAAPPAPEQDRLVLEYDLPASPAKVWRALSDPALADAWLGPADRELMEVEPGRRLTYRWRSGAEDDGPEELATFEVSPGWNGGARLRILHRAAPVAANDNRITMTGGVQWAA